MLISFIFLVLKNYWRYLKYGKITIIERGVFMPINTEKPCICLRCGKEFTVKTGDNITIKELKAMSYCNKCKLILLISKKYI